MGLLGVKDHNVPGIHGVFTAFYMIGTFSPDKIADLKIDMGMYHIILLLRCLIYNMKYI